MNCPSCKSAIPPMDNEVIAEVKNSKTYAHDCHRCRCLFQVTVTIIRESSPELIKKYTDWMKQ
jgi:hypothetical protein